MADIVDVVTYYKARLDTLAPLVGATFPHGIYAQDWGRVAAKVETIIIPPNTKKARWWTVTRRTTDDVNAAEVVEPSAPVHAIQVEGFDAANQEGDTEPDFQRLADQVRVALSFGVTAKTPRPKVADGYFQVGPAQLTVFETGTLAAAAGNTVHHAVLSVRVEERRQSPGGPAWCRR